MKTNILLLILTMLSAGTFASPDKKQIQLNFRETTGGLTDIADIYMDNGLQPTFVAQEDIIKNFDSLSNRPFVYSFTSDNIPVYSNGFGSFTQTLTIPIGFKIAKGGNYELSATSFNRFDGTTMIQLEDKVTGQFTNLRSEPYIVALATQQQTNDRFVLHLSFPPTITALEAGCFNNDGTVTVEQDNSITWTSVMLFDSKDSLIQQIDNTTGNVRFTGLPKDYYSVGFVYDSYSALKTAFVDNHQILLNVSVSSTEARQGETLQFNAAALNTDEYVWSFGDSDSSRIAGVANPEFAYYLPGTYTVTVDVSNIHQCVAKSTLTINVGTATSVSPIEDKKIILTVQDRTILVYAKDYQDATYRYEIYNLAGQMLLSNPVTSQNTTINLDSQASGMYIVNIKNRSGQELTRKIFVE